MDKKRFYIVKTDFGTDAMFPEGDMFLFQDYKNAKFKFDELKDLFRKEWEEDEEDFEINDDDNKFEIWEEGYYSVNHAAVRIHTLNQLD